MDWIALIVLGVIVVAVWRMLQKSGIPLGGG